MAQDTFLLVDDDVDTLSLLGGMLGNFPQTLVTALNGTRALELLNEETPALVIVDMVMPDISGSEIVKAVRNNQRLAKTKVIIITSLLKYVSDDDKARADHVLVKPIQKRELEAVISKLLG
jgi:two-component system, OmpR family, alkaline phosphatase synthesis response regulator PhoP